jgi:hypothetical protein
VLPYDRPTLLVVNDPGRMAEATTHPLQVGFDIVQGYLEGGIDACETSGYKLTTLGTIRIADGSGHAS